MRKPGKMKVRWNFIGFGDIPQFGCSLHPFPPPEVAKDGELAARKSMVSSSFSQSITLHNIT
jgi:hypothetical protein